MSGTHVSEDRISRFLAELTRWAPRTNLVGSTEPAALADHVADSLAAAAELQGGLGASGRPIRAVDLGSGAGFPGIPIALARPDVEIVLVEIRERRVHFLKHVVRTLELGVEVRRCRIENAPEARFDVAFARALAPPARTAELARPWIREAGELWLWTREDPPSGWEASGRIPLGSRGAVLRLRPGDDATPRS